MLKKLLIYGLAAVALYACLPSDFEKPIFAPGHYRYLLHGDSTKYWLLTERWIDDEEVILSACDTALYFQFKIEGAASIPDSLKFHNYRLYCTPSEVRDTLLRGRFRVAPIDPDIGFTDTLFFFINNDTMLTIVKEITPTFLDVLYEYEQRLWIRDRFIWIDDPTRIVN